MRLVPLNVNSGSWRPALRALRWVVPAALMWLCLRNGAWHELPRHFASVDGRFLLPVVVVLSPAAVILRALRWRCLMPGGREVPLHGFVRAYLIGIVANALLPGKMGDLVKARALCERSVSYGSSLGSAVADRVVEAFALVLLFAVTVAVSDLPVWAVRLAVVGGGFTIAALLALYAAVRYRTGVSSALGRIFHWLPAAIRDPLLRSADTLIAGCAGLCDRRRLSVAVLFSFAVWTTETLAVIAFVKAFSIAVPLFTCSVLVLAALNFGTLLPLSPGSVGLYQALCMFTLAVWRVPRELGFSLGVVMQAVLFIPLYIAGAVYLLSPRLLKSSAPTPGQ